MSEEECQIADQTLEFIRNLIKNEQKKDLKGDAEYDELKLLEP